MFGRVVVEAVGGRTPSQEWLHSGLEGPHSVAHRFCQGCGLSEEVNEELFRRFAAEAGVDVAGALPQDLYVETSCCDLCDAASKPRVDIKKVQAN